MKDPLQLKPLLSLSYSVPSLFPYPHQSSAVPLSLHCQDGRETHLGLTFVFVRDLKKKKKGLQMVLYWQWFRPLILTAYCGPVRLVLHPDLDPVLVWPVSCREDWELGVGYPKASFKDEPRQKQINVIFKNLGWKPFIAVPRQWFWCQDWLLSELWWVE